MLARVTGTEEKDDGSEAGKLIDELTTEKKDKEQKEDEEDDGGYPG
ncbi:MAG: hypothetical protein H0X73_06270 [Chthoniobacterales bacterium]|nr:hypothetical protein [Chthoniobacterales bacterium]